MLINCLPINLDYYNVAWLAIDHLASLPLGVSAHLAYHVHKSGCETGTFTAKWPKISWHLFLTDFI